MLLYGMISDPLTAALGVESWIGSLAESLANRIPWRGQKGALTTAETYGPTPAESSEKSSPALSSSKTSPESWATTGSESGQTYKQWATALRKDYSRRLKSGRHTAGSGSLSWPTPNAHLMGEGDSRLLERRQEEKNKGRNGNGFGLTLAASVTHWPTPRVTDTNGVGKHGDGGQDLRTKASRWPTPTSRDHKDNNTQNVPTNHLLGRAVIDHSLHSGLQALLTSTPGHTCSPKCRRLNPLFVEMLMGWPTGWTLLPTGQTDSACSVMELSLFVRQQHSTLLWLER